MNVVSSPIAPVTEGILGRHLRAAGPSGSCASNLQQIGEALKTYAENNDGALPPVLPAPELRSFPALSREFREPALFRCPQFERWALRAPHPVELNYKLCTPLPKRLPDGAHRSETEGPRRIALADNTPRHIGLSPLERNCLSNDGSVMPRTQREIRTFTGPPTSATTQQEGSKDADSGNRP